MGNSIKLRADMFYQILQRFLYDSLVLNFQIFCFSLTKKKLWEFSAMVKNHGQSWFGPSLLYLGPTIQENHNKQMLLTFQECLPLKNHHGCAQSTGTFHQTVASETNEESSDKCEQCS